MAVKDEQPEALTTTNVHTDISKHAHSLLFLPGFYLDALDAWEPYVDFMSFDAYVLFFVGIFVSLIAISYPNMYAPEPSYADVVGQRLAAIRQRFPGKPVMVMETGYPVAANASVQIASMNFTEELQTAWITEVYKSCVNRCCVSSVVSDVLGQGGCQWWFGFHVL
jgi:hypothetical protein